MSHPPEGISTSPRSGGRSFRALRRRNWHDPLTVVVQFAGGNEAWCVIKSRGAVLKVPGYVAIADVLAAVNSRY